jgi:hypothetical protein
VDEAALRDAYANHPTDALVSWNLDDPERNFLAVTGAWSLMSQYHAAAHTQVKRIWDSFAAADAAGGKRREPDGTRTWVVHQRQGLLDIHFYFTCWAQVRLMMRVIVNRSGFPRVGIPKEHQKLLDHYRDGRDALEHHDERLHGGKEERRMKDAPWNHGSVEGQTYSFGAKVWNIGQESLADLDSIVAQFEGRMREVALERQIANTPP